MARTFALPEARSFALGGQVRLSPAAPDPVIDRALGLPDAEHGGVTATSGRRLPGGAANRAMTAIDGDPDTWYSPGFLDQHGEYLDFTSADRSPSTALPSPCSTTADHSVPRGSGVEVDGRLRARSRRPARHRRPVHPERRATPSTSGSPRRSRARRIAPGIDDGPDARCAT